jgi:hypothetical protein
MFVTRRLTVTTAMASALIATAFAAVPAAAAPEVMTVCGIQQAGLSKPSGNSGFQLSSLSGLSAEGTGSLGTESLALTRDHDDFDIIVNWHQADEHSLRAAGVDVLGMDLGGLVHLMVALSPEHIEHYLFNLDDDGSGDVLLSRGSSLREDDALSLACTKPR